MTIFNGTGGNDTANSALGILDGFTGGTVTDLTDGVGDSIIGGDGDDFVFAGSANDHIEGGAGFDLLNGAEGDDVIYANTSEDQSGMGDELVGNLGNDRLYGSSGADSMFGSDGDDFLIGYLGADVLDGGDGSDILMFFTGHVGAGETIDGGGGFVDTIFVAGDVTFTNAAVIANIEVLLFNGPAVATFTANQIITGFPTGLRVAVNGLALVRTFRVEMGSETSLDLSYLTFAQWAPSDRVEIVGDADNEVIFGTAQVDYIFGNGGDDTLTGNGIDRLAGGVGNDFYLFDEAGVQVIELAGEGNDSVLAVFSHSLEANVENLTLLGTGHVNGTGNKLANTIVGTSGNNVLNGGAGADSLQGGLGNDTYLVDNAGDVVSEAAGAGTDTVRASLNYALAAGLQVETLATTNAAGTAAIELTGNELANILIGNAGANTLKGLAGNDTLNGNAGNDAMTGGLGNDTYFVDSSGDMVVEAAGQGTDTVHSSVSETLSVNIENLVLTGVANINGIGNSLANTLTGNAGNNILDGRAGNDTMRGGAGNDTYRVGAAGDVVVETSGQGTDLVEVGFSFTLTNHVENLTLTGAANAAATGNALANTIVGNGGNNVIAGKNGNDLLTTGGGADIVLFDTVLSLSGNIDTIADFNVAADTIRLENAIFSAIVGTGTLTLAQFVANTSGTAQDSSDRIVYETDTGKLFYDSNGNGAGGAVQFAKLTSGLALTNADFFII